MPHSPAVDLLRGEWHDVIEVHCLERNSLFICRPLQGLWRGTIPGQLLAVPYTAVQFLALQQCRTAAKKMGLDSAPAAPYVAGAIAGAAGTIASYPFDLLRTTLAAQGEPRVYAGMVDAAQGIVRQHGIGGLYRGLGITILEIMPYAALQFGLYDAFQRAFQFSANHKRHNRHNRFHQFSKSTEAFLSGLAAGTFAKLGTHPLDVAKKRFQVAGLQRSIRYGQRIQSSSVSSLAHCLREIMLKEGINGFYKGALPSVLKAAPSAAVTFACYDFFFNAFMASFADGNLSKVE